MLENSNKTIIERCCVCHPEVSEIKNILKEIFEMMKNTNQDEIIKTNSNKKPKNCKKENEKFDSFLNFILSTELPKTKQNANCQHKRLYQFFSRNLKCSEKELDEISHYLFNENLKRTYQLQVISDQVKNIGMTLLSQFKKKSKLRKQKTQPTMKSQAPFSQSAIQSPQNIPYSIFSTVSQSPSFIFNPFVASVSTIPSLTHLNQYYYGGYDGCFQP